MTTYMDFDNCQVVCSCWRTKPLCFLYFCRYCLELRCGDCVSHEVDSHYCPNCLENMASAEAKMRKHKCGNCSDCPSCGNTLSARATAVLLAKSDEPGKTTAQKVFYLTCSFCRWSTRDSGIPDQHQTLGGWQETANPHVDRISALMEGYHHLAVKEKANLHISRHFSRPPMTRNYMLLLERYPVLNPHLRRSYGSSWMAPTKEADQSKVVNVPAAEAPEAPTPFDVSVFTKEPLQLDKITNIQQRHLAPLLQPTKTSQLEPRAKSLVVKRSMRCRACEHNLSKANFNPSSIKFLINLAAFHHVPELRYVIAGGLPGPDASSSKPTNSSAVQPSRRTSLNLAAFCKSALIYRDYAPSKTQHFVLTVCNPAHSSTVVSLRQLTSDEESQLMAGVRGTGCPTPGDLAVRGGWSLSSVPVESTAAAAGDQGRRGLLPEATTDAAAGLAFSTVTLSLPSTKIEIARRNDVADLVDTSSPPSPADDPKVVAFRRGNKVGIHVGMTPLPGLSASAPLSGHQPAEQLTPILETQDDVSGSADFPTPSTAMGQQQQPTTVPLRAALRLSFEYKSTTTAALASTPSAVALAAGHLITTPSPGGETKSLGAPGGSAGWEARGKTSSSTTTTTLPGGEQHRVDTIEVNWLLYFGEMTLT